MKKAICIEYADTLYEILRLYNGERKDSEARKLLEAVIFSILSCNEQYSETEIGHILSETNLTYDHLIPIFDIAHGETSRFIPGLITNINHEHEKVICLKQITATTFIIMVT